MSHRGLYDQPGRSHGNDAMVGWMCQPWTAMPDIDFGSSFSAALRDDGSCRKSIFVCHEAGGSCSMTDRC